MRWPSLRTSVVSLIIFFIVLLAGKMNYPDYEGPAIWIGALIISEIVYWNGDKVK